MNDRLRILLTGFGPFPGAPFNPTEPLVSRLLRLRRPALIDVELTGHIFPVTYGGVDRELPELLASRRPHALLMFGLASRTAHVRIETRARNAVTTLWPDAGRTKPRKGSIAGNDDAVMFGPHTDRLLRAALATGIDARISRDAGSYLCNANLYTALGLCAVRQPAPPCGFIHLPYASEQLAAILVAGKIDGEALAASLPIATMIAAARVVIEVTSKALAKA